MINLYIFFCFFFLIVTSAAKFTFAEDKVECPCLEGHQDECTSQVICVYGINETGGIFFNGKNDKYELTKIAIQRKNETRHPHDDVLVNFYNSYETSLMIFYYGCRKCDDLKRIGNITESKLKIFLLSLYNQRMKYNIKYAQSDYKTSPHSFIDYLQPMPIITVRPFWKKRLMLRHTCAHKQRNFTQKHFIPAFLSQELCILDYRFINYTDIQQTYHTDNGEITYSLTLSWNGLYTYGIVLNSSQEFQNKTGVCKVTFDLLANKRMTRFFCLCITYECTIKVTLSNPLLTCPYKLAADIDENERGHVYQVSAFMDVDKFFMTNESEYCFFVWRITNGAYTAFIRTQDNNLPIGYTVNTNKTWYCPVTRFSKKDILPLRTKLYRDDPEELRYGYLNATIDHSKITGDIYPVGANCLFEGALSHPHFSSGYGSNSSMFPCYRYFDIHTQNQLYPMMGINALPITIISKGKDCYYYNVKLYTNHMRNCTHPIKLNKIMTIAACPENVDSDVTEFIRIQRIVDACPRMKPGQKQWRFEASSRATEIICGQYLRGLKLENGKYVPEEVEFKPVTYRDLNVTRLSRAKHGCGFDSSQNLTLCTCYASLGGCDNLYTAGRVHLLRYLPFKNSSV